MAYSIQRKQRISEVLELRDETGAVIHTLKIELDIEKVAPRLYKAKKALAGMQAKYAQAPSDEALEAYGKAVVELIAALFGAENAQTVIEFYNERYLEMLTDLFPFITEVIYPRFNDLEAKKIAQFKGMRNKMK